MKYLLSIITVVFLIVATPVSASDQISIVGSSTVFPFSSTVAEVFGQKTDFRTPIIESTGSGGGFKLFCRESDLSSASVTNSSRRIKDSEIEKCTSNGVTPVEVKIGYDGIVLATSGEAFDISLSDLYLALSNRIPVIEKSEYVLNWNMKWSDINPNLPDIQIDVIGPPPTSGTRDAFVEIALERGCVEYHNSIGLNLDKKTKKSVCHSIREDGVFVEAGENDNVLIKKLGADENRIGIFGFSFLDNNRDVMNPLTINGIEPEFELIASSEYPISRSLFFYVKEEHIGSFSGLVEYVREFVSDDSIGEEGYLVDKGLIPLSEDELLKVQSNWND